MPETYRDLIVWQRAMDLVEVIYRVSSGWHSDERFGLTSQVRRAAVSISSNIAEGNGRQTAGEGLQFLSIAMGSLYEVETQVSLARRLKMIDDRSESGILARTAEIGRLLGGLIKSRKVRKADRSS
ncbi:MAG: four helix bundle protein [Planctomycetes bacterium]|jgi:four helix bundle protein|nr:four helix bundle protein [Planctomycetota bacterium]MCL4728863.1 four helix bundle protein [Planctomycetota bacterium]